LLDFNETTTLLKLPVIGEVMARGKRPAQLASEIQERLKAVLAAPSVTVTLDAGAELKVSVVGEGQIRRPRQ
jgi:protein involved in polysaccharide export with SLBB domain